MKELMKKKVCSIGNLAPTLIKILMRGTKISSKITKATALLMQE